MGVGEGLRVKVNANLGTSPDYADVATELEKLKAAEEAGTDAVMDLSTGGDVRAIRRTLMEACRVTVGTVPIYEAAATAAQTHHDLAKMTADDMLAAVRRHAEDGVDFVTVHCGVTRRIVESEALGRRVCGIVSRGGMFLAHWMRRNRRENPLHERFDEVIDIARGYGISAIEVSPSGPLADRTLAQLQLSQYGVLVLAIQRGREVISSPDGTTRIEPNDRLICYGSLQAAKEVAATIARQQEEQHKAKEDEEQADEE